VVAEYRFRYTEEFFIESLKRHRDQHQQRLLRRALKAIGFLGLGALFAGFLYEKLIVPSLIFAFLLMLLAFSPQIDYWWAKRSFRKSPFYNSDVVIQLSEQGYLGRDANSRTQLGWPVFTKGRRFPDGFLLFTGPHQFHWWPNAALSSGTTSEVDAIVRRNVAGYEAAELRAPPPGPRQSWGAPSVASRPMQRSTRNSSERPASLR